MFGITFRKALMTVVVGAFLHLLYIALDKSPDAAVEMAGTLPYTIIIVLMLPVARLTTEGLIKLVRVWKTGKEE